MAWYQPLSTPPIAGAYFNAPIRNESDREFEFEESRREPRRSGRDSDGATADADGTKSLLQDPLSRRMMSLISPMVSMSSSAVEVPHQLSNSGNGSGSLPFIAAARSSISPYPHPSFEHRHRERDLEFCGKSFDQTNGYFDHAYFFHPRGITSDKPFASSSPQQAQPVRSQRQHEYQQFHHPSQQQNAQESETYHQQQTDQDASHDQERQNYAENTQWNQWDQNQYNVNNYYNPNPNSNRTNHPFGHSYPEEPRQQKRKRKKQTRINQNQPNIEQEQGWGQVGQIGSYHHSSSADGDVAAPGRSDKSTKSKKKKKKSKKRPLPDIRAVVSSTGDHPLEGTAKDSNGEAEAESVPAHNQDADQYDDNNFEPNPGRSKRTKRNFPKDRSVKSSSMTHPDMRPLSNENMAPTYDPIPISTMETFAETYDVKNAGGSDEALISFLQLVKTQKHVSWTMIFHDDTCSTPFAPSTKRYCTPKGPPCQKWNCTCDNQIRAMQAASPLVGAMFVFPMESGSDNLDCFLLPLCPTFDPEEGPKDIDPGFERMARWPFLPICCDSSLQQRWETFRKILLDRTVVKVTFNAQVALLPYHFHCANDMVNDENNPTGSRSHGYMDLALPQLWDLRLASWMLSPHADEVTLEMAQKKQGFSHLIPRPKCDPTDIASEQLLGLIHAKEDLEFLHVLFPLVDKILENNGLKEAFYEVESPLQSILSSMESFGIGFKAERLLKIQGSIEEKIEILISEAKGIAKDDDFMLSSPQQVSNLLFVKMGLSPPKTNKTSQSGPNNNRSASQHKSTSEESLKAMQNTIKSETGEPLRIIELILQFRALNKVLNTYIKPYPKLARNCDSLVHSRKSKKRSKKKSKSTNQSQKIHPMWMQTSVRTGRLSCRKPNLQQVPTGSVMGVCPRNAFVTSSKQSCLFACDYSQNEVRILASISGDEALIGLFTQTGTTDIYKQMASVISGKTPRDITDQERATAKQVTLAIMYGMGINSVAKKLGIDRSSAQNFFQSFYGRFRGVKRWMDSTISFARTNKYVTTITGRKR